MKFPCSAASQVARAPSLNFVILRAKKRRRDSWCGDDASRGRVEVASTLAMRKRVGGSRSPQPDGKTNRGFAAHLFLIVFGEADPPAYSAFQHLIKHVVGTRDDDEIERTTFDHRREQPARVVTFDPEGIRAISPGSSESCERTPGEIASFAEDPEGCRSPLFRLPIRATRERPGQAATPLGVNRIRDVTPGVRSQDSLDPGLMACIPSGCLSPIS
jgi:hypothetical protein